MLGNLAKNGGFNLNRLASHLNRNSNPTTVQLQTNLLSRFSEYFLNVVGLISDKDVFQERFEVEPSSGVLTEESLCAVCKIRLPDDNWQPQTVALVSISITQD